MTAACWGVPLVTFLLVACNNPTTPSQLTVPHFSSTKYEHLDCRSLKLKIDELSILVQELTIAQDNRVDDSGGHAAYYGWGSGDGMETIELVKIKGERDAVDRVYDKKGCTGIDDRASR